MPFTMQIQPTRKLAADLCSVEYEYMKKDAESLFKKGFRIAYF